MWAMHGILNLPVVWGSQPAVILIRNQHTPHWHSFHSFFPHWVSKVHTVCFTTQHISGQTRNAASARSSTRGVAALRYYNIAVLTGQHPKWQALTSQHQQKSFHTVLHRTFWEFPRNKFQKQDGWAARYTEVMLKVSIFVSSVVTTPDTAQERSPL